MIEELQTFIDSLPVPWLFTVGLTLVLSFFCGKLARMVKLPSLIGYMLIGVLLGPSVFDLVGDKMQEDLSFITEIALGLVAFTIGLELSLSSLKRLGGGIVSIILAESFGAFIVVTTAMYLLTKNIALSLIFGAVAPASAPAGTVAVIQEFKAKGNLTKALYAVVGFDDGLAIIIFGFAAAVTRNILERQAGVISSSLFSVIMHPMKEVFLSLTVGLLMAAFLCILLRNVKSKKDFTVFVLGFVLMVNGLCVILHLSLILTNMILGFAVANTQQQNLISNISDQLGTIMTIFFILFFTLAGAHLHVELLPSLGVIGIVYIITRSLGLIGGSRIGAMIGGADDKIRKYIGLGILSQAGVAIGLALIVKHEFAGLGPIISTVEGGTMHAGDSIGIVVLTTVTVTCIFFEIIGPILTKVALHKAGEIRVEEIPD